MKSLKFYLLIGFLVVIAPIFGQQNNQISKSLGSYNLLINPIDGTFRISFTTQEEPILLVDSGIPYGSFFRIIENSRPVDFSQLVSTIRLDQTSDRLGLEYDFRDGSQLILWIQLVSNDELRLSYRFSNTSDQQRLVQFLFDTVLGEIGGNHYFVGDIPVTREFGFTLQDDSRVSTPIMSGVFQQPGLSIQPELPLETNQLVQIGLGNTRRLTETFGFFTVNSNRNFNLLPFSVNDSAVLSTQAIESDRVGSIIFRLKYDMNPGFQGTATLPTRDFEESTVLHAFGQLLDEPQSNDSSLDQRSSSIIEPNNSAISIEALQERLTTIDQLNRILLQIDQALSNPNLQVDNDFLQAELERIRRSSGL